MPNAKSRLQWQLIEAQSEQNARNRRKLKIPHAGGSKSNARRGHQMDKISEHLSQDQERAATLGVPLKIFAHPNDAIGKIYGAEHSSRVRGLGGNVCPSAAFGMARRSISHPNFGGSSNMSHQRVEDLEKHVETLEEKLIGYEETKEKLEETMEQEVETKEWLAQNENQLETLHTFLQAKFGSDFTSFNLHSS